jgi:hypothetical protein
MTVIVILPATSNAQMHSDSPADPTKHAPDVPAKITTPDTIETQIGTLRFKVGAPIRRRRSLPTINWTSLGRRRLPQGHVGNLDPCAVQGF